MAVVSSRKIEFRQKVRWETCSELPVNRGFQRQITVNIWLWLYDYRSEYLKNSFLHVEPRNNEMDVIWRYVCLSSFSCEDVCQLEFRQKSCIWRDRARQKLGLEVGSRTYFCTGGYVRGSPSPKNSPPAFVGTLTQKFDEKLTFKPVLGRCLDFWIEWVVNRWSNFLAADHNIVEQRLWSEIP